MPGQGALRAEAEALARAGHGLGQALTMARGTIATRSFWQMKISARAGSEEPRRGYSTCQLMGCVPDRLLKLAISKSSCTTSWNRLVLLGRANRQGTAITGADKESGETLQIQLVTCAHHTSRKAFSNLQLPQSTQTGIIHNYPKRLLRALWRDGAQVTATHLFHSKFCLIFQTRFML